MASVAAALAELRSETHGMDYGLSEKSASARASAGVGSP